MPSKAFHFIVLLHCFLVFSFRIKCNSAFVCSMGGQKCNDAKIFNAVSVHNKHPSTGHSDTDRRALLNVTSNSDYQLIISEDYKCQTYCCRSFSIGRIFSVCSVDWRKQDIWRLYFWFSRKYWWSIALPVVPIIHARYSIMVSRGRGIKCLLN